MGRVMYVNLGFFLFLCVSFDLASFGNFYYYLLEIIGFFYLYMLILVIFFGA